MDIWKSGSALSESYNEEKKNASSFCTFVFQMNGIYFLYYNREKTSYIYKLRVEKSKERLSLILKDIGTQVSSRREINFCTNCLCKEIS